MRLGDPHLEALRLLVDADAQGVNLSLQAIAEGLDLNSQAAAGVLERLEDDGLIEIRFGRGDDQIVSAHVLRVTSQAHRVLRGGLKPIDPSRTPRESSVNSRDRSRIFISHARQDRNLADSLVDLLRLGTDIRREQLFYTSGAGTGVPVGTNFVDYIRDQLRNTALVIQLVSPAFLRSKFCLCELGGVWALEAPSFPVLVPPVSYEDMRGVLGNMQVVLLESDGSALDRLHDRVRESLGANLDAVSWYSERAKFLTRLPALLQNAEGIDEEGAAISPQVPAVAAASDAGDRLRNAVLRSLAELHDRQTETSMILDLDVRGLASRCGVDEPTVRRELSRLLTEGLAEGFAQSKDKRAIDGACRITGAGLRALASER